MIHFNLVSTCSLSSLIYYDNILYSVRGVTRQLPE